MKNETRRILNAKMRISVDKALKTFIIFCIISSLTLPNAFSQALPAIGPEYLSLIHQKIAANFIYPKEAMLKGWEGAVKVKFTLIENGRIKDIDVLKSSGYPVLDAAAMLAVKDASPYSFLTPYTRSKEVEFQTDLVFKAAGFEGYQRPAKQNIKPQPKETLKAMPNYARAKSQEQRAKSQEPRTNKPTTNIIPKRKHSPALSPQYLEIIQQKANEAFFYPEEAKSKGWKGIVKVKFTIAQDGRISYIDIAESSGYPLLDAAAMLTVKDASPYPFPSNYSKEEIDILLPLEYALPIRGASKKAPRDAKYERISPEKAQKRAKKEKVYLQEPVSKKAKALVKAKEQPSLLEAGVTNQPEELTQLMNLALKNNQPAQIAQKEVELARIKVLEARRGFFPAVKLQTYQTQGDVYKIKYEEREGKVQVDQPLYYSGRLKDTLAQAKVNFQITKRNYDRLRLDIMHKTETAYYNLITARINLRQKELIGQEGREALDKIEKLAALEMTTTLELSSGRSWLKQIDFQMESVRHELHMAELTLRQVLNMGELPEIKAQTLEARPRDVNLDACLAAALKHRPEIYLGELLVKFNQYGKKIETSKGKFSLDLTGSYGHYQGHYLTEPWRDSENWYAGIKFSQPFGANTINSSYSTETSQPRFGQTSATQSRSLTSEFNLLDNLKRVSDRKKADIDFIRSVSDLNETSKTVSFEVQDAFLNYQKAALQLNTSDAEIDFRRQEKEITKIRAMVAEVPFSNILESLLSYSDAQSKNTQAIGNYYISLANLKKACGYGLKI